MLLKCPSTDFFGRHELCSRLPRRRHGEDGEPHRAACGDHYLGDTIDGDDSYHGAPAGQAPHRAAPSRLPVHMPAPPAVLDTQLTWVSHTSALIMAGAEAIQDGIRRLPAPIRRELTRHVILMSGGGTPRGSAGNTPWGCPKAPPQDPTATSSTSAPNTPRW